MDTTTLLHIVALSAFAVASWFGVRTVWKFRKVHPLRDAYIYVTGAAFIGVAFRSWTLYHRLAGEPPPQPLTINAALITQIALGFAFALALAVALYPAWWLSESE